MGWLLACLFAMLLWRARRRLKALQRTNPDALAALPAALGDASTEATLVAYQHLYHLLVFTQELERLHAAGTLDLDRSTHLSAQASTLQTNILRHLESVPQSPAWQRARAAAWELLVDQQALQEHPPWDEVLTPSAPIEAPLPVAVTPLATSADIAPALTTTPDDLPEPALPSAPESGAADTSEPLAEVVDYAWEPAAPSALERALHTVAGWPAIVAPFLVQNLGWFIGGLCFVAGSVFLVTYTSGFTKTLTSFAVLALYTLLLLYGGYQIRRRHPALEMSSTALLILGMLLVPLNVTAAVRLLITAQTSPGLLTLGLLATGLGVGGVYATALLVSGIMERTLQRQHARLFLALAAVQLAVPILTYYPAWPLLMLCHGAVLGLLAYGSVVFLRPWLDAIFLERQKLAYYAAGTLVYAALVSFVHVTWGAALVVPQGYYGPWLMLLCGLLFYVDAHLKPWRQQVAVLSYLSFGLYGVSIIALLLAVGASLPLLMTLVLTVLLYGLVTWQYATLPPLYLLLGCVGWLYHEIVLQHLPYAWYFLGSLPGYAGLWAANRWLERRQVRPLALVGYRILVLTLLSVAGWSVVYAQPGWVALATALLVMAGAFVAPAQVPTPLWRRRIDLEVNLEPSMLPPDRWATPSWLYLATGVGLVAAAYTPPVPGCTWVIQSLWGVLLWATVWTTLGLRLSRIARAEAAARSVAFLNSALLFLAVCITVIAALALPDPTARRALPLLLGVAGSLFLWLSLVLGTRGLFYGVLGLWGTALVLLKLTYLPAPGSGITTMGLVLLLWAFLWWLDRTPDARASLRQERAALREARSASLTLLWCYPVAFDTPRRVVQAPLRQTMVLVWTLGVLLLWRRLLVGPLGWTWVISAGLGTGGAVLMTGSLPWPWLLPIAITLGLGAVLVAAGTLGLTTVAGMSAVGMLYAALAWRLGVVCLAHPIVQSLARMGRLHGDRLMLERLAHGTACGLTVLGISMPLMLYGALLPGPAFLGTLAVAAVFWALAGQRYQSRVERYLALENAVLGLTLAASWGVHMVPLSASWPTLLWTRGLGLIGVLLSIGLWGLALLLRSPQGGRLAGEALYYRTPLLALAVQMALLAAIHAVCLVAPALSGAPYSAGFLTLGVLGLAGVSLLGASDSLQVRHQPAPPPMTDLAPLPASPQRGEERGIRVSLVSGLTLTGLACLVLATLGAQSLWWHATPIAAFWLGQATAVDQWGTLALIAGGGAGLAQGGTVLVQWRGRSRRPLYAMAYLTYGWAVLGVVGLCVLLPLQAAPGLFWACLVLALALLPLSQPLPGAAAIRGAGVAIWLTTGVVSALSSADWYGLEPLLLATWAYALWLLATLVLPRYNARWPRWAMAPDVWPWLGLLCVVSVLVGWGLPWDGVPQTAAWRLAHALSAVALYGFLLLRTSAWRVWPWLAVGTLTSAILVYNVAIAWAVGPLFALRLPLVDDGLMAGTLLWGNLLLLGVTLWRRHGATVARYVCWQAHNLAEPLLGWATVVLSGWLLYLALWDGIGVLVPLWIASEPWAGLSMGCLGLLLVGSWLHVLRVHPARWAWHGSLAAVSGTLLALWLSLLTPGLAPLLFLALWNVGLIVATGLGMRRHWPPALLAVLTLWSNVSPVVTLGLWPLFLHLPFAEHLCILALLGSYAACRGWQRQQRLWWFASLLAGVLLLHSWWFVWLPPHFVGRLLPWYMLQLAALTWLVCWVEGHFHTPALASALAWIWPLLVWCALLTWGVHLLSVIVACRLDQTPQWLLGPGDAGVAVLAILAFMALGIRQARRTTAPGWVYGVAMLGGSLWLYGRLLWFGLAPVQIWDTVALIGASYALFLLQHVAPSTPLLHIVLLLPLLAVLTTPLHLASLSTSMALVTIAGLYLGLRRTTGRTLPLYLGLLTLNMGLYLWVPGWVRASHALQLYTVPAALSVLWLLQAHRAELRPQVLHGCRLAATSVLYVSATLDVFLRADIAVFLVALGLSLVGIVIGIALRTRAFLYAGVSFFVLNIAGQLILLFPEQRLTRAIVLLGLGTLITGGMIWFNIQREALLQRLRLFRADLATWS
jgi:hypothetical protein